MYVVRMSLLPTSSMANSSTAYFETVSMVDELEKTIMELRAKIALMETTIAALSMVIKTHDDVAKMTAQNADMVNMLRDMHGTSSALNRWMYRNKWV